MALTKLNIIEELIARRFLGGRDNASNTVESLLEIMKRTLASGEDVLVSGFGKFSVKDKGERKGRNPATGKAMTLKERRVVTFQCANTLREKVNGVYVPKLWK